METARRTLADVRTWALQHQRLLSSAALITGFVIDNLMLTRIDQLFDNIVLIWYLTLAAAAIIIYNLVDVGRITNKLAIAGAPFFPVVAQYAFGGLFSGFFVFYSRSASFAGGWLFVGILIALILFNERFAHHYLRFRFQMSILFVALFSYAIFSVPVVLGSIGPLVFIVSGLVSLAVMGAIVYLTILVLPEKRPALPALAGIIAGVFVLFNGLYFTGAIPPLPLSLKEAGVYHSVERTADGAYALAYEPREWYQAFLNYNTTYHRSPGEPVYVFTSVFAPTRLTADITHEWQRHDAAASEWVTTNEVRFPVIGGRDGGYRGYSLKHNISQGRWRVNVRTTSGGLMVGRVTFVVETVPSPVELERTER